MWMTVLWGLITSGLIAWILWRLWQFTAGLSTSRFLVVVLVTATALRLLWILYAPTELIPGGDCARYHEGAINIMEGNGDMADGKPTAWHAIGYKLTLSVLYRVFGPHVIVGQLADVALGVFCVWLAFKVSGQLFGETVARGTALILALFPGQIYYSAPLGSDIQAQALYLMAVHAALLAPESPRRGIWLLVSGVCLGLGALTRPVVGLLGVALFLTWLLRGVGWRRSVVSGAIVATTAVVVIIPWIIRNYQVFHTFVPISTQGGVSLWLGANPYTRGSLVHCDERMYVEQYELMSIDDEIDRHREASRRAVAYIQAHPIQWLRIAPAKAYYLYEKDEGGLYTSFTRLVDGKPAFHRWEYAIWIRLANAYFGAVMVLFCFALLPTLLCWKDKATRVGMLVLITMLIAHTLPHTVLFSADRYNHTVMPLFVAGASLGLSILAPSMRSIFSLDRDKHKSTTESLAQPGMHPTGQPVYLESV